MIRFLMRAAGLLLLAGALAALLADATRSWAAAHLTFTSLRSVFVWTASGLADGQSGGPSLGHLRDVAMATLAPVPMCLVLALSGLLLLRLGRPRQAVLGFVPR